MERVKKILDVSYIIEKSNPPNLVVTAKGQVPTTGWGPTQLLRRIYKSPPSDGIWEYDLLSTPPAGPAGDGLSEVEASDKWIKYSEGVVKGIRVYGKEDGFVEKPISNK